MEIEFNPDNDNLLRVMRVRRRNSNNAIEYDTDGSATVQATLKDPDGNPLTGQSWPFTLQFAPDSEIPGTFLGNLEDTIETGDLEFGICTVDIEWDGVTATKDCQVPFRPRKCTSIIITSPEDEDDDDPTEIDIIGAANSPAQMTGDEGTVRERPISELIEADRYQAAKNAQTGGAPFGMRVSRIRPGGTVET